LSFRVGWNLDRWLDVADPAGEHMGYSIGCCIEAASTVAKIEYEPNTGADLLADDSHAGQVHVKGAPEGPLAQASDLLDMRRTNRAPFSTDAVESSCLREFERQVDSFGVEISILLDRPRIRELAKLTTEGAAACFRRQDYLDELLQWMRLSKQERASDPDGFTPDTLLLDPLTTQLVSCLKRSARLRRLAPKLGMARMLALQAGATLKRSGAILLLTTREPSTQGFISGGRALMRVWLSATAANLAFQPVHFPLSADDLRDEVRRLFGLDSGSHPITVVRIGYARSAAPASERLPLGRIVTVLGNEDLE
jgi:hypothetical protein